MSEPGRVLRCLPLAYKVTRCTPECYIQRQTNRSGSHEDKEPTTRVVVLDTATRPPPMAPHHRGRGTVGRLPAFDTFHTITNLTGWQEGIFSILLVTPCVSARCGEPVEKRTEQKANNDKSPRSREDWWGSSICLAVGLVACSRTMIEAELFSQRGLLGTSRGGQPRRRSSAHPKFTIVNGLVYAPSFSFANY